MSTHKLLPWFHLCLGNIHSQYKIIKVKEKITSSFLGLPLAGAQMKPEFETRVRSQEQSASLLILLSCLKLGSIKKILDLFSFLWGYSSAWSVASQSSLWQSYGHSVFERFVQAPSLSFSVLDFFCLFPMTSSLQQQQQWHAIFQCTI